MQFVDYGNRETVPASRIRPLDAGTAAVPPQAHVAALWGLQVIRYLSALQDFGVLDIW